MIRQMRSTGEGDLTDQLAEHYLPEIQTDAGVYEYISSGGFLPTNEPTHQTRDVALLDDATVP